jgi:hypothetical protein
MKSVGCYRKSLIDNVEELRNTAKHHALSIQALFLAAYCRIHPRFDTERGCHGTTPDHIIIGVYLANRSHSFDGLPDLIAPTLNIVPLCVKNPLEASILNVARRIQADLHEIGRVENSCVSLLEVADWTGITLDTVINFIRLPGPEQRLGDHDEKVQFFPLAPGRNGKQADEVPEPSNVPSISENGRPNTYSDVFMVSEPSIWVVEARSHHCHTGD